ncbi:MAG: PLP-dependent aminotransferase family protein [Steroidobacteraceae bacterium]
MRLRIDGSAPGRKVTGLDVIAAVMREYEAGQLPAGCRLPPVRVLQHQLGIAKNTVNRAYEELVARGVVDNRSRLGYFILARHQGRRRSAPVAAACAALFDTRAPNFRVASAPGSLNLGSAFIDNALLPRDRLAQCLAAVLRKPGFPHDYTVQGFAPLRALIAQRLARRGVPANPDDVIITTGSQQAIDLVARALRKRSIATENPAYGIAKRLFEICRLEPVPLTLDPFVGIDLATWRAAIAKSRPAALYLTPNFHNPTGYSYSTLELTGILELSREFQFGLLEDDWGSDMLSFSDFRPPLRALGGDNVLYMNSFTKKLLPSLRIGYLLANERTRPALLEVKHVSTLGSATISEILLFEFLSRGYYDTHLRSLQAELDRRYRICLETLAAVMPDGVRWSTPGGGPILWLEVPRAVDLEKLAGRLAARKVLISRPLNACFFGKPHLHGTRIGFAYLPVAAMQQALDILSDEIRRQLRRGAA